MKVCSHTERRDELASALCLALVGSAAGLMCVAALVRGVAFERGAALGTGAVVVFAVLMLFGSLLPVSAQAADEPTYNQFSLEAQAEGKVENDLMKATLVVEHEHRDASALASKVNQDMQWALKKMKAWPQISNRTENYSTWPVYHKQRIDGWRSSQTLALESPDFDTMKLAIQTLQEKLQVRGMQFLPSSETRKKAEDALITEALDNFKHRAEIVQKNMGSAGYKIVQVSINTSGSRGVYRHMEADVMSMSKRSSVAAPAVEGGESAITVNINGQIQLQ